MVESVGLGAVCGFGRAGLKPCSYDYDRFFASLRMTVGGAVTLGVWKGLRRYG